MSNAADFGVVCSGLLPTYQLASAVQQRAPRIPRLQHRSEHRSRQQQMDVEQSDAAQQAPRRSFSQYHTHIDGSIYLDHALNGPAIDAADDFPLSAADHACSEGVVQAEGVACVCEETFFRLSTKFQFALSAGGPEGIWQSQMACTECNRLLS
jgi:hypothetical protein